MSDKKKRPDCCGIPMFLMDDGNYFCIKCKKTRGKSEWDKLEQTMRDLFGSQWPSDHGKRNL
jgi:uncharacterized Zn finger protein (UPF0148 family)